MFPAHAQLFVERSGAAEQRFIGINASQMLAPSLRHAELRKSVIVKKAQKLWAVARQRHVAGIKSRVVTHAQHSLSEIQIPRSTAVVRERVIS